MSHERRENTFPSHTPCPQCTLNSLVFKVQGLDKEEQKEGGGSGEATGEQRRGKGKWRNTAIYSYLIAWFLGLQTGNQDLLCHTPDLSVLPTVYIHAGMHPMVSSTWRFGRQERWGGEVFTLHTHHQHHWRLRNGNNTDNSHTINILSDALLFILTGSFNSVLKTEF